jgi:hypothetical protein
MGGYVVFCAGVRPHKTPHLALRHGMGQLNGVKYYFAGEQNRAPVRYDFNSRAGKAKMAQARLFWAWQAYQAYATTF